MRGNFVCLAVILFSSNKEYCAARFENAECNSLCNTEACLYDGLDCDTSKPQLVSKIVVPDCVCNGQELQMDLKKDIQLKRSVQSPWPPPYKVY